MHIWTRILNKNEAFAQQIYPSFSFSFLCYPSNSFAQQIYLSSWLVQFLQYKYYLEPQRYLLHIITSQHVIRNVNYKKNNDLNLIRSNFSRTNKLTSRTQAGTRCCLWSHLEKNLKCLPQLINVQNSNINS
jgi:hypothetical protein